MSTCFQCKSPARAQARNCLRVVPLTRSTSSTYVRCLRAMSCFIASACNARSCARPKSCWRRRRFSYTVILPLAGPRWPSGSGAPPLSAAGGRGRCCGALDGRGALPIPAPARHRKLLLAERYAGHYSAQIEHAVSHPALSEAAMQILCGGSHCRAAATAAAPRR